MSNPAIPVGLPDNQPQLQFAIRVGAIGPNNTDNVFSDYQKLIMLHARRIDPARPAIDVTTDSTATGYFLFGSRDGRNFMKSIDKSEAERFMVETFQANMSVERATMIDAQPMSKNIHVYSANCVWHGPIENVGELKLPAMTATIGGRKVPIGGPDSDGLPCCPHCKSVLFETEEDRWQEGMKKHEETHPGYTALMNWIEQQPRCYSSLATAALKFTEETGQAVAL